MKKIVNCLFLLGFSLPSVSAQVGVQNIEMGQMLWYVLPFYLLTLIGLSLFLHKLIRPKSSPWPQVVVSGIAVVWAIFVTMNFKKIQDEQLGGAKIEAHLSETDLSDKARADLKSQQQEQEQFWFGNFYTTAMPNIVLLALGLILHFRQQRSEEE